VGASLLAIAVCHSTHVLPDTPQSPAGWLPQCFSKLNFVMIVGKSAITLTPTFTQ
jgi:hypothetical protein